MVAMVARLAVVCGMMLGTVGQVCAQDPTRTLPDAYQVQFENDHVRVDVVDEQFSNKQLRITPLIARSVAFEASANTPALVVAMPAGSVRWVAAGERFLADSSDSRAEILRIDFLTAPRCPRTGVE